MQDYTDSILLRAQLSEINHNNTVAVLRLPLSSDLFVSIYTQSVIRMFNGNTPVAVESARFSQFCF